MAIQIFRGRVDHKISAELDGSCQDGGRRSAVDGHAHIHGMGNLRHGREVRDVPHWVGGCLDPQEARPAGANSSSHLGQVRGVDELDVEPPRDCELREPPANAPVENPRDEDMIPGKERLKDCCCRRAA